MKLIIEYIKNTAKRAKNNFNYFCGVVHKEKNMSVIKNQNINNIKPIKHLTYLGAFTYKDNPISIEELFELFKRNTLMKSDGNQFGQIYLYTTEDEYEAIRNKDGRMV